MSGREKFCAEVTSTSVLQNSISQRTRFFDPKTQYSDGPYVGEIPVMSSTWCGEDSHIVDPCPPRDCPKDDDGYVYAKHDSDKDIEDDSNAKSDGKEYEEKDDSKSSKVDGSWKSSK